MKDSLFKLQSTLYYTLWLAVIFLFANKLNESSWLAAFGLALSSVLLYLILGIFMFKNCYKKAEKCVFIYRFHSIVLIVILAVVFFGGQEYISENVGYFAGMIAGTLMVFFKPTKFAALYLKWKKIDPAHISE
jgi:hypothetical protein